jgi:hypothetical protein
MAKSDARKTPSKPCPHCGKSIHPRVNTCPHCGKTIEHATKTAKRKPTAGGMDVVRLVETITQMGGVKKVKSLLDQANKAKYALAELGTLEEAADACELLEKISDAMK